MNQFGAYPIRSHLIWNLHFQRSPCDLGTCESLEIMTLGDTFLHRLDKFAGRPDNMILKPREVLARFVLGTDEHRAQKVYLPGNYTGKGGTGRRKEGRKGVREQERRTLLLNILILDGRNQGWDFSKCSRLTLTAGDAVD